jgi:hypothetical protein
MMTDFPMWANSAVFGVSIDFGLLGPVYHVTGAREFQVTSYYLPDPKPSSPNNQVVQKNQIQSN